MPGENVQLACRVYDAVNRRDPDSFLALMDEQIAFIPALAAVEGGYHGHDGVRRWWDELLAMVPDYTVGVEEVRELRSDLTLAELRIRGHGAGSRAPIDQKLSQIIQWWGPKAVRLESILSETEALEAVGLRE